MLTHFNLVANLVQMQAVERMAAEEVVIGVVPFHHVYGFNVVLNLTLHAGATLVVLPRFDVEEFLRAVQDHAVTTAFVVPPIVRTLARPSPGRALRPREPSLHHVGGGAVAGGGRPRLRPPPGLRGQAGVRPDRDGPHDPLDPARRRAA